MATPRSSALGEKSHMRDASIRLLGNLDCLDRPLDFFEEPVPKSDYFARILPCFRIDEPEFPMATGQIKQLHQPTRLNFGLKEHGRKKGYPLPGNYGLANRELRIKLEVLRE